MISLNPAVSVIDTRHPDGGWIPAVSLVIPVFNVAAVVTECLRSVQGNALGLDLELIVIDDGSTDDSARVVEKVLSTGHWPPTLFLRQSNQGLSAVRNLGARLARGEYLAFLDSDDRLAPGGMASLLALARRAEADVAMGRTLIFDGATGALAPFYDAVLWGRLLGGQPSRVFQGGQESGLLALEPNANYRLVRRVFYREQGILFPEGLLFEDAPVHFRMLARAQCVVLQDAVYYHYRVNRPGKITEQRSHRRFDVLRVARLAVDELKSAPADPDQGGAALRVLFRLVWGCGTMTPPDQQGRFFREACEVFGVAVPRAWIRHYRLRHRWDPRHWLLGELLIRGESSMLAGFAAGRRPLIPLAGVALKALVRNDLG